MYHLRSLLSPKSRSFSALLLGTALLFGTTSAASAAISSAPQARQELNQTHLSAMRGSEISRIDWRQPEMKLRFDLAESNWTDGIDLILSMTPQGDVATRGPVLVSLNNSPPLKLNPYGKSFDARLRFDENFVRAKGNVITIRVPAPHGAPCLTSSHGHWDVNTRKSSIVVRTRAKTRNLYLREVTERLKNPATAPKTVSILASGSDKARLQMLGAQGIALQTKDIPNFKTTAGRSDMELVIGRRDQIGARVSDRKILSGSGATIAVHKGRPMRLVITGDTDYEVIEAAKSFASHKLPPVRRRSSSAGVLLFQPSFADTHAVLDGKTRFSDLGKSYSALDWRGVPNKIKFNVTDPITTSGKVMLRLSTGEQVTADSQVLVELNGQSLGFAALDRKRKSVSFDIPEGALRGADNELTITPKLSKRPSVSTFGESCPSFNDMPGFHIGGGSRIELTRNDSSPITELSRLTADGGLFAAQDGKDTHIVLSASHSNDLGASLEVLAKLARTSGSGWTEATVSRNDAATASGKNVLIVGPKAARTGLLGDAPRALSAALKGRSSTGQLARNSGDYEKFASADAAKTLRIYAAKTQTKSRINSGGVAAVYPQGERLIGVISSTPGRSFASVSDDLLKDKQWNTLSGSVARWNSRNVLMAQTAIPAPAIALPSSAPNPLLGFDIAQFDITKFDIAGFDLAWLDDNVDALKTRTADWTAMAALKFGDMRSLTQTSLAQTATPSPQVPLEMPVYKQRPKATPSPASLKTAIVKTAAVKTAPTAVALPSGSPAPSLRGFSKAETTAAHTLSTLSWSSILTDKAATTISKIKLWTRSKQSGFDETGIHQKLDRAEASFKSPVKTLAAMLEKPITYYNILIAIALTIMALLLSLVSPKQKNRERRLAITHKK